LHGAPYRSNNRCEAKGAAMIDKQKRVLRAPEAANYIGLSESTLAKRRLYGLPPAFLNLGGRAIGYDLDEFNRWLETCRRQSTSQGGGAQ
jgi:predicted DNA-binding transcriptional regulator AlpA